MNLFWDGKFNFNPSLKSAFNLHALKAAWPTQHFWAEPELWPLDLKSHELVSVGRFSLSHLQKHKQQQTLTELHAGKETSFCKKRKKKKKKTCLNDQSENFKQRHKQEVRQAPRSHDGVLILPRADVCGDVGILVTWHTRQSIVRFADSEEEWCVVPRGQLDDVSEQRGRTQAEHVHTCRNTFDM